MTEFVVIVLGVAVFLYAFLAGADFGAGILELLPIGIDRKEKTELIGKAMGPVWEANHIWLILALVISFNGFPRIFWFISEYYHFPLGALAIGIIFRGASFTFLHYDPIKDNSQKVYHWIFGLSSLWCCFWIGVIVGSLMLGDFSLQATEAYEKYFRHWVNIFSFCTGIFLTTLMMFNASLFLYVESAKSKREWKRITLIVLGIVIISGLITHIVFYFTNAERWKLYFMNPVSITMIIVSALLLLPQFIFITHSHKNTSRVFAGIQLLLIISAGFVPLYPKIVLTQDGSYLDVYTSAAEPAVMKALVQALVGGSLLIFPAYFYLMKIFKTNRNERI
jgi:cytochrome d ubiquinol oxidase subunit II